jgi:serine/threonine protein kinase HipA of HipAB toxin-antitoxin module
MADDLENSGQWRDAVETRLSTLEAKVEEEARLRAAMDEDLSGARADRNMLQALHDTQSEHSATLNLHTDLLNQHSATLNLHTEQLTQHTEQLNDLQVGQQKVLAGIKVITDKLDTLIGDDG